MPVGAGSQSLFYYIPWHVTTLVNKPPSTLIFRVRPLKAVAETIQTLFTGTYLQALPKVNGNHVAISISQVSNSQAVKYKCVGGARICIHGFSLSTHISEISFSCINVPNILYYD